MNKPISLVLILVLITSGCKDRTNENQGVPVVLEDSVLIEKVDTVLTGETIRYFDEIGFSTFAKSKKPGFDWSSFHLVNVWKEDTLFTTPFQASKEYFDAYGQFIKYSSDSTMFIDLDSYNIRITKTADGKFTGDELGPDTEVSLVDLQDKEKKRLIFLGPGSSIEDGGWLDSQTIVLAGIQADGNGETRIPVIFKYHLPTRTFFLYEMQDSANATALMRGWRDQRLKNVLIR